MAEDLTRLGLRVAGWDVCQYGRTDPFCFGEGCDCKGICKILSSTVARNWTGRKGGKTLEDGKENVEGTSFCGFWVVGSCMVRQ